MKRISVGLISLAVLSLTACASFQRSVTSGYGDNNLARAYREVTTNEETRSLSRNERAGLVMQMEVKRLEKEIPSDYDRQMYYRIKPLLANDQERAEFLRLPDRRARERWMKGLGVSAAATIDRRVAAVVEEGDIELGMTKNAVLESWGDPSLKEVAGNPENENERWLYYNFVNSADGYQREARVIYFESGVVSGWETR